MLRANETIHTPGRTIEKGTELDDTDEAVAGREHLFGAVEKRRGRRSPLDKGDEQPGGEG